MIRVLTLNLQHGAIGAAATQASDPAHRALAGGDVSDLGTALAALGALAEQIAELSPDVVLLQEVDHHQARSAGLDQTQVLAGLLGMAHHRFAATWAGPVVGLRRRPRRSALAHCGDDALSLARTVAGLPPQGFGNAILSRQPVTCWRVQRLGRGAPTWTRRGPVWDPRGYRLWTASARLMLTATLEVKGQVLTVATTHLATSTTTARRQLAAAWRALATVEGAHLLGGDLNLRTHQVAQTGLARALGQGATYPAEAPDHRIDHFLTDPLPTGPEGTPLPLGGDSGPVLRATGWGTRGFVVSDHAGAWVDLEPLS